MYHHSFRAVANSCRISKLSGLIVGLLLGLQSASGQAVGFNLDASQRHDLKVAMPILGKIPECSAVADRASPSKASGRHWQPWMHGPAFRRSNPTGSNTIIATPSTHTVMSSKTSSVGSNGCAISLRATKISPRRSSAS